MAHKVDQYVHPITMDVFGCFFGACHVEINEIIASLDDILAMDTAVINAGGVTVYGELGAVMQSKKGCGEMGSGMIAKVSGNIANSEFFW